MNPKERKGAEQQARHGPERPKKDGVLLGVLVVGMRHERRKAGTGFGVAFLAGSHAVPGRDRRTRITSPVDAVRGVTVVAGCYASIAEAVCTAMEGVEILVATRTVTFAANVVTSETKILGIGGTDVVAGVARGADWSLLVSLVSFSKVNARSVFVEHSRVAGAAGFGNMLLGDFALRVARRQEGMCFAVTIRA